jgi:hypothetical protein
MTPMTTTQINYYSHELSSNGNHLAVSSICLSVIDLVQAPDLRARVESVFAEACNLVTESGQRFSLVSDRIGDGPLNAVLSHAEALCVLDPGSEVTGDARWLHLGHGWRIDLRRAQSWDPVPNYQRLAVSPHAVMTNVAWLWRTLPVIASPSSFAALPAPSTEGAFERRPMMVLTRIRANQLTRGLLAAHRHHSLAGIQAHARQLAGLGPGLTPAGDDWLGGWLVGLHVRAAMAQNTEAGKSLAIAAIGRTVIEAAAGRTTGLSLAYLSAAAHGAVPRIWHDFLYALVDADPGPVQHAAGEIMCHGATSGSDTLAGFLAAFGQDLCL